jgi:hypothetical protein
MGMALVLLVLRVKESLIPLNALWNHTAFFANLSFPPFSAPLYLLLFQCLWKRARNGWKDWLLVGYERYPVFSYLSLKFILIHLAWLFEEMNFNTLEYNHPLYLKYTWILFLFRYGEANRSGGEYHWKKICNSEFPREGNSPYHVGPHYVGPQREPCKSVMRQKNRGGIMGQSLECGFFFRGKKIKKNR